MCLIIDKKVRNNHHKEGGYCVGYKVLRSDNRSPYQFATYGIGWKEATLRIEPYPTYKVNYGLHIFLNKKEAILERSSPDSPDSPDFKIIKVYYKPEDVIAYGTFDMWRLSLANVNIITSVVNVAVKKLLVKSLKDIR